MNSILNYGRKHTGFLLLLFVFGNLLIACDAEEPCASQVANRFRIGFFVPGEERNVAQAFYFDEVRAVGAENSLYEWSGVAANGIDLSLNPNADTTTFVFYYDGEQRDTLQLAYKRNSRMISPDCELAIDFTDISMVKEPFSEYEDISVNLISTELSETNTGADFTIVSRRECAPQRLEDRRIRFGFYRINEEGVKEPVPLVFQSVSPLNSDSIYYTAARGAAAEFDLDLNPEANSVTYLFQENPANIDTLTINYNRRGRVVSAFCLPDIYYVGISSGANTFDSVSVVRDSLPLTPVDVAIEIYR